MNPLRILRDMARPKLPPGWKPGGLDPKTGAIWEAPHGPDEDTTTMAPDPYDRLRRPPMAQPQIAPQLTQMQPAPQGMPMGGLVQGVGGETEGDFSGFGDVAAALTGYLKKRRGDSAAGAKEAFEAGGSL